MKRTLRALLWLSFGALAACIGLAAAQEARDPEHGAAPIAEQLKKLDSLEPAPAGKVPAGIDQAIWAAAVPADNLTTADRVALGRKLYFEKALSKDGTVSCATCHDATRSFTDRRNVSEGVDGKLGKRNAPTTMNAMLLHTQFWDGRAATLEDQAGQPILNPVEMAMPDEAAAVAAIKRIPEYGPLFQKAYGRDVNYADIQRAIAAFERTLVFLDAPFDRFLAGEENAISADARAGWVLFNGEGRCVSCHMLNTANPLGTDNRFHNIGVSARHQNFEELAVQALAALQEDPSEERLDELALATDFSELGRFMVTRNYANIGAFRTSQLRNIGITAPYMHDGSMATLWDTIDHYNKGGEPNAYLDGGMEPLALEEREIDQLVAFLFTLTDDRFSELNQAEIEKQRAIAKDQRPFRDTEMAMRKVLPFEERVMGKRKGGAQ